MKGGFLLDEMRRGKTGQPQSMGALRDPRSNRQGGWYGQRTESHFGSSVGRLGTGRLTSEDSTAVAAAPHTTTLAGTKISGSGDLRSSSLSVAENESTEETTAVGWGSSTASDWVSSGSTADSGWGTSANRGWTSQSHASEWDNKSTSTKSTVPMSVDSSVEDTKCPPTLNQTTQNSTTQESETAHDVPSMSKEKMERILEGARRLANPAGPPKACLHIWYGQKRDHTLKKDFVCWDNGAKPHELKFTGAFCCPLTGEIFLSGTYGAHVKDENGIVWYNKKTGAEHGAASRAYDCQTYRVYMADPVGLEPYPIGLDEPYLEPIVDLPDSIPAKARTDLEKLQQAALVEAQRREIELNSAMEEETEKSEDCDDEEVAWKTRPHDFINETMNLSS